MSSTQPHAEEEIFEEPVVVDPSPPLAPEAILELTELRIQHLYREAMEKMKDIMYQFGQSVSDEVHAGYIRYEQVKRHRAVGAANTSAAKRVRRSDE